MIVLRGHTLLCLQGFRGEGYSASFVENLASISEELKEHPECLVKVVDEPDAVCGACPHHAVIGCQLNGEASESAMRSQDRTVLVKLGLQPGEVVAWQDVLARVRDSLTGTDLPNICGNCRWLPLGYCRDGIDALKTYGRPVDPPASGLSSSLIRPVRHTE
jgi:uncharacterized protein